MSLMHSLDPRALILVPAPSVIDALGGEARVPHDLFSAAGAVLRGQRDQQRLPGNLLLRSSDPASRTPGSYQLTIRAGPDAEALVEVLASDHQGVRNAAATLLQILRQCPERVACLGVRDQPVFAVRGVMLDISRDRVPTMEHFEQIIDLLATLKFNHMQLYTEHAFAYGGHESVWRDASPLTPAEVRRLDAFAAARGIELAANQNCFGHLAKWLKLDRYRHLAEIQRDDQEWRFMHFPRFGPFSLCPIEPQAEEFVRDLLSQLVPCFASPRVNIGCDETFDVGWGRSKAAAESLGGPAGPDAGRAALFFDFVSRISRIVESLRTGSGVPCTPLIWGDIALSHPEMLHRLSPRTTAIAWEYEPSPKFEPWVRSIRDAGLDAWVAPGTSSWRSFTGRTRERRANIADAAEQGARAGAIGLLVCDWGDVGHRQCWTVSLPALAQAAQAAWDPAGARDFDDRAASLHVLNDHSLSLAAWLEALGNVDADVREAAKLRNATAFFNDLHAPLNTPGLDRPVKVDLGLWIAARERLESLRAARPPAPDALTDHEITLTLLRVQLALDHAIAARTLPAPSAVQRRELLDLAQGVIDEHRRLWFTRSRPGGLSDSLAHDLKILDGIRA